jgi:hypothetical protein
MLKLATVDNEPVLRVDCEVSYLPSLLQCVQFVTAHGFPLTVMGVASTALRFYSAVFTETLHTSSFWVTKRSSASFAISHADKVGSHLSVFQFDNVTRVMPASFAI